MSRVVLGATELPERQAATLRRAIRFEWTTIAFLAGAITLVGLVAGNSQAMKVACRPDHPEAPDGEAPDGYHRSVGVAHLVAGVALFTMGAFLIFDPAVGLFTAEHPSIGSVQLFGQIFWLGWLMVGAMVLTGVPPVLLGRVKIKLAKELHDKVLYADAEMNPGPAMNRRCPSWRRPGAGVPSWTGSYTTW